MLSKISFLEEFLNSKLFTEFGKCLIIFGGLFEKTFMYLRLLFVFLYDWHVPLISLKVTSRNETSNRFVLISILKPKFLNTWMILFLSLSVCWSFQFFTTIKPSSLYNPTFWSMSFVRCDNINIPISSHTSSPSCLLIVTSKQDSVFFFQTSVLWNSKDFLLCFIIRMSSLLVIPWKYHGSVQSFYSNWSRTITSGT